MQSTPVLITDLDGTILKSMPVAWDYLSQVAIKKGKKLKRYSEYSSSWSLYVDVIKTFWLRAFKLLPRMRRYMYLNDIKIEVYPGTIEALKTLKNLGWKVVIVTDNDDEYAKKILSRHGLELDPKWIELYSAETETKLSLYIKVLKKYRKQYLYFASHDTKDFGLLYLAMSATGKSAKKIFTPNEIDTKSMVHPQLTLTQFAKKTISDQ